MTIYYIAEEGAIVNRHITCNWLDARALRSMAGNGNHVHYDKIHFSIAYPRNRAAPCRSKNTYDLIRVNNPT
ncbi:predicted protein [Botrytis cinerea T4]|uniref:Uncharacterized protein n=1 Tax=Botryotinia fuckeliana (strain T4) TaxID=999810 RepID=G2YT31_BOTF4|nr:predicted protein [Botrytis cinerea T4]